MRDPHKTNRIRRSILVSNIAKRAALASALILPTTAMADEPQKQTTRILPPLPVMQVSENAYTNPFFRPENQPVVSQDVSLVSGNGKKSEVRLKAIGNAIGLQPIDGQKPVQVRAPALRIEKLEPRVQLNPLIKSKHNENPNLVDADLTSTANERLEELELVKRDQQLAPAVRIAHLPDPSVPTIKEEFPGPNQSPASMAEEHGVGSIVVNPHQAVPPSPVVIASAIPDTQVATQPRVTQEASPTGPLVTPDVKEAVASTPAVEPSIAKPAVAPPVPEPSVQAEPSPHVQPVVIAKADPDPAKVVAPPTPSVQPKADPQPEPDPEPIMFSMSDSSEHLEDNNRSKSGLQPVVVPDHSSGIPAPIVGLAEMPSVMDSDELLRPAPETNSPTDTRPSKPSVIYGTASKVNSVIDANRSLLSQKQYRPPVAVDAPPMVLAQDDSATPTVGPVLQNPVALAIVKPKANMVKRAVPRSQLTKLHMSRAQVRSLTIGGHVRRVNVANQNVCQAIAAGPNQVKLIGTGYGVTRLVVWADTEQDQPTRVRTFEIHVEDAVETDGSSVTGKTEALNESIMRAFPNAAISIHQSSDRLLVVGECDTEDEARKIIRMVRKTCIIPVRDEVKVR